MHEPHRFLIDNNRCGESLRAWAHQATKDTRIYTHCSEMDVQDDTHNQAFEVLLESHRQNARIHVLANHYVVALFLVVQGFVPDTNALHEHLLS